MSSYGIAGDVKELLTITIKPRYDSYADQWSRIVMVKITMMCAFFAGLNW